MVGDIAKAIRLDFPSHPPLLIGALKAAFVFMADLARALEMDCGVDFIQSASYGKRDSPSTEVLITRDITASIRDRDVIIVEGITDRGHTAKAIMDYLSAKEPASLRLCSLLARSGVKRDVTVDYAGAYVEPGFIVGYGMDYKERFRHLPGIYVIETGK
ncbi:MAG: hypoxanthine phosphoribosyltransferase [Deltaproteobacteria bacterium]|nr:hypoxanthine phosphoribosyltransferase [Deltaproteobacteria bacterium]